jgi:hypothetical protein
VIKEQTEPLEKKATLVPMDHLVVVVWMDIVDPEGSEGPLVQGGTREYVKTGTSTLLTTRDRQLHYHSGQEAISLKGCVRYFGSNTWIQGLRLEDIRILDLTKVPSLPVSPVFFVVGQYLYQTLLSAHKNSLRIQSGTSFRGGYVM